MTNEERIKIAKRIAIKRRDVDAYRSSHDSIRDAELKELILFILDMPDSFIAANIDKFAEFTK
jgi:hypothetical protein